MRRLGTLLTLVTLIALATPVISVAQEPTTGATVEVLDPGAEPRAALRLTPATGVTGTQVLTMSQSFRQTGASSASFGPLVLRQVTDNEIGAIAPDGSFEITQDISSMSLLPASKVDRASRRQVEANLRDLQDLRTAITMTSTGAVTKSSSDIPSELDPTVRQLLSQIQDQAADLATPLPTEPVGVGARWKVTQHLTFYGIDVLQTGTYTLRSHTGSTLELDVEVRQTARRQPADLPGVPSDVDVQVTRWRVNQHGHFTHDLTQPYPVRGQTRLKGLQVFRADDGHQTETIRQRTTVKVTIEPG